MPLPIQPGLEGVAPMLAYASAAEAIEFYKKAFGAEELFRLVESSGKVAHAEIRIGHGVVMLSDVYPKYNRTPQELGGTTVVLHLYVADVDQFAARAVTAGAKLAIPIQDQFYGDRSGRLEDPFGYIWMIGTRKEGVSPQEMQRRYDELMKQT